jgi:hypothetical protein
LRRRRRRNSWLASSTTLICLPSFSHLSFNHLSFFQKELAQHLSTPPTRTTKFDSTIQRSLARPHVVAKPLLEPDLDHHPLKQEHSLPPLKTYLLRHLTLGSSFVSPLLLERLESPRHVEQLPPGQKHSFQTQARIPALAYSTQLQ